MCCIELLKAMFRGVWTSLYDFFPYFGEENDVADSIELNMLA